MGVQERIVISFRVIGGRGRGFVERVRALEAAVCACGGALVGFDATKVTFAFEPDMLAEMLAIVAEGDHTAADETPWSVGLAQGVIQPITEVKTLAQLAWGPASVAASLLSNVARPREVLCDGTVRALHAKALLTHGVRVARERGMRLRGHRIDPRAPWRQDAVDALSRLRVAPLVGIDMAKVEVVARSLVLLRADPGAGGTRLLAEVALRSPRSLLLSPSGSGFEPLGALRRALARSITRELSPRLIELVDQLEGLLSGESIRVETAARLIGAYLAPKTPGGPPGALLIDDAKAVDPASLEACVRAVRAPDATFGLVVRLDASSGLPSVFASVAKRSEIELPALSRETAEALAGGVTSEALDPQTKQRWAHLGGNVPLGVIEALSWGVASGEIRFADNRALPRTDGSGRGRVRSPSEWIVRRARRESEACRTLLALVALLGGEAKVARLARILAAAGDRVDVEVGVCELVSNRWLVDTQEDWVALPSRTHRDALAALLTDEQRKSLHGAAADVIELEEGTYGLVEAGYHAARAGDEQRASRILLTAARATADALLDSSTTQLIAFARRTDPACEESALELLSNALSRGAPSMPPPSVYAPSPLNEEPPTSVRVPAPPRVPVPGSEPSPAPPSVATVQAGTNGHAAPLVPPPPPPVRKSPAVVIGESAPRPPAHDSEPPTIMKEGAGPFLPGPPPPLPPRATASSPSGNRLAVRLGELAKEALLAGDNAALERWVDGLRAAGESPVFTERMRAMVRLRRGDIGDALRVLRRSRSQLEPDAQQLRCQASLALGVALSVAGRPQEALLEGLDALARARQSGDARGAGACLAFLSKLYTSMGRADGPSP